MDLDKMIAELQAERQCLDEAIDALERLSTGDLHHRGRPRWLKNETPAEAPTRQESDEDRPEKRKRE